MIYVSYKDLSEVSKASTSLSKIFWLRLEREPYSLAENTVIISLFVSRQVFLITRILFSIEDNYFH